MACLPINIIEQTTTESYMDNFLSAKVYTNISFRPKTTYLPET